MGAAMMPMMLGAGLVGSIISAQGQAGQMQAQAAQMRANAANSAYQAQVADNNAATARINAGLERQSGEIASGNQSMKTRMIVGRTKAEQSASGVDVNTGSFVDARAAEVRAGMTDALTIRSNAAKKAWADETQATNYDAEGELLRQQSAQGIAAGGRIDALAPTVALGSMLTSASSMGGSYYKWMQG